MENQPLSSKFLYWQNEQYPDYRKLSSLSFSGFAKNYIANITESDETKLFEFLAKCDNCEQLFIYDDLFKHVCQYDDQKNFIFDEEVERSLWHDSPLRRMYLENNRQTQQILEQLKGGTKESKTMTRKSHHVCSFCHRMYVHASGLARHMETHNSNDQYISRSGAHQKKSSSHVESSAAVHRCLICGRIYGVANLCSAHVKAAHPDFGRNEDNSENIENIDGATMTEKVLLDVLYKCEYCDGSYASIASLMKHQIVHDVTIGFECCECEIGSRNLKFILNHRKNECPFEMYGREAKINLKQHFVCDKCEAVFDSLPQLYEHRYSINHFQSLCNHATGRQEIFCEKCGEIVSDDAALLEHTEKFHLKKEKTNIVSTNSTTRPYLCEICGKGYTQSSHLYQHLRFHKGIKPFECNKPGCNRRFTIRPDLNDHIRKCHTGERPYKCADCNKTFLTGSVYYQHRLIHRNERRYACKTCDKRFHRSDALKNHERIHSGEKPYLCGVCTKTFRQKGDRDKHFRSRHQNSLSSYGLIKEEASMDFLKSVTQIRPVFEEVNGINILTMTNN